MAAPSLPPLLIPSFAEINAAFIRLKGDAEVLTATHLTVYDADFFIRLCSALRPEICLEMGPDIRNPTDKLPAYIVLFLADVLQLPIRDIAICWVILGKTAWNSPVPVFSKIEVAKFVHSGHNSNISRCLGMSLQ